MRISRSILVVLAAVLLGASFVQSRGDETDFLTQTQFNRRLRLTGARRSETAAQHLIATFVEARRSTNVITVSFATGRTTPIWRTIHSVISGVIDWETPRRMGLVDPWHLPKAEVVFSAPTNLVAGDFSGWFLVSLLIDKTHSPVNVTPGPATATSTNWPAQVNGTNVLKTFRFRPTRTEFRERGTRRQSFTVVFKIEDKEVPADYFMTRCWDTEVELFKEFLAEGEGYITVVAWTVTASMPGQQFPATRPFLVDGRILQGSLQMKPRREK
jgi:hypothetical protein